MKQTDVDENIGYILLGGGSKCTENQMYRNSAWTT